MRTFKLTLGMDVRVVVPDQFVADMREVAQQPDATAFLKKVQEDYPTDDETFILQIIKNGTRKHVRLSLASLYESSGLGCTLAPASLAVHDRCPPPESAVPVLASEIDQVLRS